MKRVIVESPYAGDVLRNLAYARRALRDAVVVRGESPYASHLLLTQPGVLDDEFPAERTLGIEAGLAWGAAADYVAVYADLGVSPGMILGIRRHRQNEIEVRIRKLDSDPREVLLRCTCSLPCNPASEELCLWRATMPETFVRCNHRESGGVRCELAYGHAPPCDAPKALEQFLLCGVPGCMALRDGGHEACADHRRLKEGCVCSLTRPLGARPCDLHPKTPARCCVRDCGAAVARTGWTHCTKHSADDCMCSRIYGPAGCPLHDAALRARW